MIFIRLEDDHGKVGIGSAAPTGPEVTGEAFKDVYNSIQLNLNSNNPQKFDPKLTTEDYFVLKIFPESNQTAILLVDKLKYNPKIKYKVTTSTEIARYNFHSQKIEWITNDGSQKGDLNLLIN